MRSVRIFVAIGFTLVALAACTSSIGDSSGTGAANTAASASANSTSITVPEIPKGRITAIGDLCKLVPADKAAEVLGFQVTIKPWMSQPEPGIVDSCNFVYFDDKGTSTYDDDTNFVLNVFVRTGAVETLRQARQLIAKSGFELSEHTIPGYDEAFYAHREGNLRKGDVLYVANGSVGVQNEARTMAFLTMVANAAS